MRFDPDANERRETAIVGKLLKAGPVAVIILGGEHDLSDNVPTSCEYIQLQTNRHRDAAGSVD